MQGNGDVQHNWVGISSVLNFLSKYLYAHRMN